MHRGPRDLFYYMMRLLPSLMLGAMTGTMLSTAFRCATGKPVQSGYQNGVELYGDED